MAAILTFIVTACLLSQYCTADAAAVDVTLLSSMHFVDSSETQFLCRAPQNTIIQHTFSGETPNTRPIMREGGSGPGNPFTVPSSRRVSYLDVAYGAIFTADAGDARVGAFSCSVQQNGQTGKAVSFKVKDTAYVLPTAFTVRANIGESATLQVTTTGNWPQNWTADEVRWSKDGQELQDRQGLQLTIASVQTSDGGIYEAYRTGERNTWNHAFSRLIVRECPMGRWGLPGCSNTCPACYNGGVCDPETGRCICTPGFSGTNCNSACDASHKFGQTCNHMCDSNDCQRKLLCAADPFGCTCGAGYRGIRCDELCSAGTFGAGCSQTCRCIGTCNMATGACDDAQGCSAGWTGPSCQEPAPVDVTLVSSSHILDDTAATDFLCRSARGTVQQTQSWPIRREGGVGPGNPLGIGSTQRLGNHGARFMADAGNTRVGAFSCQVDSNGRSGSAVSFKVKGNAYLLPEAFTTTVSMGESVTLKMTKTNTWQASWSDNQIKWRKEGQVLENREGLQLTINRVQTSDAGIYEAYREGERGNWNHAISRLIVRACPTNKWGPDCRYRCPVCYNGGVCHVETGKCVCAPGFRGDSCQSVCDSPQKFGSTCQAMCDGGSCQGKLLCPADPFGCTCGPTYTGVRCNGACPDGRFGPGCTQTCHCKGTCNRATGVCDQQGCTPGWSGSNCQVVSTNAVDFFATPTQDEVLNRYTAASHNNVDEAQCAKYCLQGTGLARGLRCKSFDMYNSGGTVQCRLNTENKEVQGSPGLSANNGGKYYERGDLSSCSSLPCANGATCLDRVEQQYTCICSPGWMGTNCDLASSDPLDYFAKYSGSNLEGNDGDVIPGITLSECATRCLQGTETVPRGRCQSFDYRISEMKCFLSTTTKEARPTEFRQGNADLEYYQREASGPCSNLPCQLPQRCQTPASGSGYQCFCPNGLLGPSCNVEAQVDVGIESKNYLVDTGNVEMYCRTVRGHIIQNYINNVHYPFTRERRGKIDIGNPFNTSISRKIYNYGVYLHEPAGDLRLGPFSCQVQQGGQVSKVVTLNMKRDAKVVPNVITQTVNVGERATLSVTKAADVSELTWHRDGDLVTGVQTSEYTIDSVRQAHAGVYEVFQPGRYHSYEHAFMRLIIRGCTKDRWGPPDCLGFCPVCRNGGVCDDATGVCVCAPGFRGVNCEKACPAGFFGPTCRSRCTFTNCREKLICLPDPYGCSCAAGFKGLDCNQVCDAGTFGPGCTLTCNCQSGNCNSITGSCTNGCKPGWSGDSCQTASNSPVEYFSKRQNHFLLDSKFDEFTSISLDECARLCVNASQQCKSVNYEGGGRRCWLNNKNAAEASLVPMNTRDYYEREDFSECSKVPCLNQGACSVSDTSQGYSCTCAPGFTGNTCNDDVNECLTKNGLCDHNCANTIGSFTCSCETNFLLGPDRRTCIDQTAPTNIRIQQTATQCTVTWDPPPQSGLQVQGYQVSATAQLPIQDDDVHESEFDTVTKSTSLMTRTETFQKTLSDTNSTADLKELRPNSVYPFRVRARLPNGRWGGYSQEVNCTVPPLAVLPPPRAPERNDAEDTGDRTIPVWLYGANERYGSVGCYQVVVVELKNGLTTSDLPEPQNLEVFNNYSQAKEAGKDYNAYVAAAHLGANVGRRKTVILGDGRQTSCQPPPSSSGSRVRRALTNQDVFGTTFTNNPLNPSTPYTMSTRAFSPPGSQPPTYSSSPYMAPITTAPPAGTGPGTGAADTALWGKIAAGIVGGALFLAALLPLLYFCWKKIGGGRKKDSFDVEGRMQGTGGVSAKADIPGVSAGANVPGVSGRANVPGVSGRANVPGVSGKVDVPGVQSSAGLSLHPGAPPVVKTPKDSAKTSCFGKKKKKTGGGIEVYSPAIDASAHGDLNAPSMNVKGPRANIDANAPQLEGEVDLRGPNVHMKKPKKSGGLNCLKKPKKPTGDIEMNAPSMNVRGPQANIDARAGGDLNAPNMNIKGPRGNIKAPRVEGDVDLHGPDVHVKKPKKSGGLNCLKKPKKPKGGIEMDVPDVRGKVSGPDVDVKGPKMNVKGPDNLPDVHLKGPAPPYLNMNAPKVPTVNLKSSDIDIDHEYEDMELNLEGPKAKGGFRMPDLNIGKPQMPDFNLKGPKVKGPDVDMDANIDADVDLPEAKGGFKMPGFNIGKPQMPDFNLKGPKVKGPDVDVDMDAELPSANIDADVDLPEAKGGFKMPGFNIGKPQMPDFNLKGPKVKGPDVDVDMDAELPSANIDADVDLPEAKGGFKMPGFNIGKPQMPDFSLKGPKVKGPDVDVDANLPSADIDADVNLPEAKGGFKMPDLSIGKPKMPDFNLKGPKVKGPGVDVDMDAELPSANIDADVDLPKAKGGFKMPGFNIGKPDFNLRGPKVKGPDVDVDVDAELPSANIDADVDLPEAKGGFKMPGFNIGKPDMPDFNLPSFKGPKVKGPDVDIDAVLPSGSIDADMDLPEAKGGFKMPGMSFSKPDLDLKGPKMPGVHVKGPKGNIGLPEGGVNVKAPGIETELPRGKADFGIKGPQAPQLQAQGPSFDVKGPKAPSMDIQGPRVKGGIDLDSPKVDLKGRPSDAAKAGCFGGKKKPTAGVDVDLKGPKLKGPKLTTGDASFSMDNPAFDSDIPSKVISWDGVKLDPKVLGKGKFGEIRKGTVKKDGLMKPAVIKMLKGSAPEKDRNDFISELDEMTRVGDHPNLVNLIGAGQHDGNMFMALELANKGTLRSYLRDSRLPSDGQVSTLSSDQLLQFSKDVAEGMQQISRKGIIHRDLSAKNVLVMEEGARPVCKVSDYGLPRMVKAEKRHVPNRWMAPESLTNNTYTTKTDVWSYGVVLWEITTLGGTPYSELESEELTSMIPAGYKLKQPDNCHDHMYILMRQCFRDDPETRPTFPQLAATLREMEDNSNETYIDVQAEDGFQYEPADPHKDDD